MIDNLWSEERPKLEGATGVQLSQQVQFAEAPTAGVPLDDYAARLNAIESWIQETHSKVSSGPVDPKSADVLLKEAQVCMLVETRRIPFSDLWRPSEGTEQRNSVDTRAC
jgi:hypothetical protein